MRVIYSREMNFSLPGAIEVLKQTPRTLEAMLKDLSPEWYESSSDQENWNPFDTLGHLIHGEKTDWIPRAEIILAQGENRTFVPFDRLAQFRDSGGESLFDLLAEFKSLRDTNLDQLKGWNLTAEQLALKGAHPELGEVSLEQLIATWTVHDLNHIRQIVTRMAARYTDDVGPWRKYLSILT